MICRNRANVFQRKNLKPFFPWKKIGSAFEAHQSATSSLRRLSINLDQKKNSQLFWLGAAEQSLNRWRQPVWFIRENSKESTAPEKKVIRFLIGHHKIFQLSFIWIVGLSDFVPSTTRGKVIPLYLWWLRKLNLHHFFESGNNLTGSSYSKSIDNHNIKCILIVHTLCQH